MEGEERRQREKDAGGEGRLRGHAGKTAQPHSSRHRVVGHAGGLFTQHCDLVDGSFRFESWRYLSWHTSAVSASTEEERQKTGPRSRSTIGEGRMGEWVSKWAGE